MFDYTMIHWMTFLSTTVLLTLSPGQDIAFILGHTLRRGRRHGFAAMLGIWTGAGLHVVMAAIGLSAILSTSALAFSLVKWAGAAYLIWFGISTLLSNGDSFISSKGNGDLETRSIYWQGILVSALNPKLAIFFLAFLPQFVVEGAGPVSAQLLLHGILVVLVSVFIEPPLVIIGSTLGARLMRNQRISLWIDRSVGTLFIVLGARLAASSY